MSNLTPPLKFSFLILNVLFLMKQVKNNNVFIYYSKFKFSSVTLNWISFEKLIWSRFSLVLNMNKTFSKGYIVPRLELTLDNIMSNYLLVTTCFTYAGDNSISHLLTWQKTDCPKHHFPTEAILWKKCVNIHCQENTHWSRPIWQNYCQKTQLRKQNYVKRLQ